MKANELPITTFLQTPNIQFIIPVYQRNYDWSVSECMELINDIIEVGTETRKTHFIGSIVFIHEGTYSTTEVRELVIIDGQQRLTTINILYVALYRFAKENNLDQEAEKIYNMFLINQYVHNEKSKLKLKQTDTSSKAFDAIMKGLEDQFSLFSNVIENFNFFKNKITIENFKTILNGLGRLIFVEISLERDKDDPQRIFESLNSTGLELTQSDLIRNYILMDLEPKEQFKTFEYIWNPIEENAKDSLHQKSMVSDYIRDYLTLRNKNIPNKNKVYQEFKKLHFNKKDEAFQNEITNIKNLSVHYKKLINPTSVADPSLKEELINLSQLEINVAFPFLLQVFEDEENGLIDRSTVIRILKLLQSYAWRRFIVGLPTNALNKIFMTLYSEIDKEDYYDSLTIALLQKKGTAKFPTNDDLRSALNDKDLYNIQAKNKGYMFKKLENFNNNEIVDIANPNITIEHIFPQTPHADWQKDLLPEEYTVFKERHLNTIANLTLSGNNSALGNKSFKDKKEMNVNGGEQGYKYSKLWLNVFLNKIEFWNLSTYQERFNIIYERFLKIWEYPNIELPQLNLGEEQNIFDIESPTFKRLEYFIFEDTKVEEDIIARMYFYVLEKLYYRNTRLLLENQTDLKISRDDKDFRSPQEISNGYFIESNIDSATKFNILKKLLKLYEIEDELIIKFAEDKKNRKDSSRFELRKEFWAQLLKKLDNTTLFSNVSPSKDSWISTGSGKSGISYSLIATKIDARVEITISTFDKLLNKKYFNALIKDKDLIESAFGKKLDWLELPNNKLSLIRTELTGVCLYEKNDWDKISEFLIQNLYKMEGAFKPYIEKL